MLLKIGGSTHDLVGCGDLPSPVTLEEINGRKTSASLGYIVVLFVFVTRNTSIMPQSFPASAEIKKIATCLI